MWDRLEERLLRVRAAVRDPETAVGLEREWAEHCLALRDRATSLTLAGELSFRNGPVITAWLNLVPLLQLDGYHMLAYALRAGELRTETVRYAGLVLRRDPRRLAYGRADRWIYSVYGAVSAVVLVGGYLTLCVVWFSYLGR